MKLRTVKKRILRNRLLNLGFEEEKGKDHIFFYFKHKGKIVVRTKFSHGSKDINQPILSMIARQLNLNREEFEKLIDDEMKIKEYISTLKSKNKIN